MNKICSQIKFGTDGWRGIIADNFTFENVKIVSQAIADYYKRHLPTDNIVFAVGYDTRFLSREFARTVAEVLRDNGIKVLLSDRALPTPAVSFAVKSKKNTAGIVITASHNPYCYNGIKIKTSSGGSAGSEVTSEVEKLLLPYCRPQTPQKGEIVYCDFIRGYINFLRSYIDLKVLKKARFRVLVDTMYGSGNGLIAHVLRDSKIKFEFLHQEYNPSFGGYQPEPIPENLKDSISKMKKGRFDVGLVFDGDADRIAAIGENGGFISPQKILGLLLLHLREDRNMKGAVVKTICGSSLLDKIAAALRMELLETPVGFKHISNLMTSRDVLIGGEEAGGIGFKNYIPERDGMLAGILLLEMMMYRKKSLDELIGEMEKRFGRYYYVKDSIELGKVRGFKIDNLKGIDRILNNRVIEKKDFDGIKFILQNDSWLMIRGSGTEPIIRVYAEARSRREADRLLDFGKSLVK